MRPAAAIACLLGSLCLVLVWEVATPVGGTSSWYADGHQNVDAQSLVGGGTTAGTRSARSPVPEADPEALASVAASVIARPLFTPGRRLAGEPVKSAGSAAGQDGLPRLTGIIVGPSGAWAIFAGADGKSRAASEGDSLGAFTVRSIDPGQVTLSGPEGERVLRPAFVSASTVIGNATSATVGGTRPRERTQ
jgi:hypothetical protein